MVYLNIVDLSATALLQEPRVSGPGAPATSSALLTDVRLREDIIIKLPYFFFFFLLNIVLFSSQLSNLKLKICIAFRLFFVAYGRRTELSNYANSQRRQPQENFSLVSILIHFFFGYFLCNFRAVGNPTSIPSS